MNRALRVSTSALAIGLALALIAGACSGGSDDDTTVNTDAFIDDVTPTAIAFDPNDSLDLAGLSIDPSDLDPGDCFNEYQFRDASDFLQQVTTIVSCNGPHDREAYFRTEFPGGDNARYPLDDELEQWADTTCLEEFEEFVGLDYVLSALEIGAVVPSFESWTETANRSVICYVFPDQGGRLLESVRNSRI